MVTTVSGRPKPEGRRRTLYHWANAAPPKFFFYFKVQATIRVHEYDGL